MSVHALNQPVRQVAHLINDFHRDLGTSHSAPTTLKEAVEFVTKNYKGATSFHKDKETRSKVKSYSAKVKASAKKALSKQQNAAAARQFELPQQQGARTNSARVRAAVVA